MTGMLSKLRNSRGRAAAVSRVSRTRKVGWWLLGVVAGIGILGALVAPPLVHSLVERELTEVLHRKVTIDTLRINPFTLEVTVRGLQMHERGGSAVVLTVEEIYADATAASLYRLVPVFAALRIATPRVQVVRLEDNRYNWSDLIDEFVLKPRDPNEPPARFSIANIEVTDGGIDFNDRPAGAKHVVAGLQLAIPFLSSLPVHQDINVEPKFSAKVDGSPVDFVAKAKLFKDSRDSTLSLDLRGLDLTRFLGYLPRELPIKVRAARLEADLEVTFARPKARAPQLVVSGKVALLDVDLQEPSGEPVLKLPRLTAELRAVEPFARRIEIAKVAIESPELWMTRQKNDEIYLLRLFAPQAGAAKSDPAAEKGAVPPLFYKIDEIALTAGKIESLDERGARPIRRTFDEVRLTMQELSSEAGGTGRFDAFMRTRTEETLALAGSYGLQPLQATGTIKLERVGLPALWPYFEPFVEFDAVAGELDAAAAFAYSVAGDAPNLVLKELQAALRSLTLRQRSDKQEIVRVQSLAAGGAELDLRAQTISVGELTMSGGHLAVRRDRAGVLNLQKLVRLTADASALAAPVAPEAGAKPWRVTLAKLAVERYAATIEDEAAGPAATARVENLFLTASNLATEKGQSSNVALKLTLNKTGTLAAQGPVSFFPPSARLSIDVQNVGIVPAQPYFERYVNAIVASGDLTARGDAAIDLPEGRAVRASFKGDVTLANFGAVTRTGNEDMLRWKSLRLGGIDTAVEPLKMAIAEIALTDFYSRLIVTPDGRLNLQGLVARNAAPEAADAAKHAAAAPATGAAQPAPGDPASPAPAAAPAPSTPAPEPAAAPAPSTSLPATASSAPFPLQIGKIALAGGNVQFSDYFIKPNYSANLTGVTGSIGTITRETAGDVDLRAKIDNAAPVEITGKINPLVKNLFLDIKASARDIELAPLTAYSAKYAGYGIEKGKLSMTATYRLENRTLTAQNKVILNQLTFGAKVDSPTATKLPVLFAVSLMKDRDGVIDIDLPISGSIDDPQFSIGGIIGRVIGNLLLKVITSPFALIGSLFGGGGEELAYIEFSPGSSALTPAADAKLKTLTKALADRPALKLDIAGRVDAEADREELRKTSIERKVKAQKLKDTVKGGSAAGTLDQVQVEPGEYPKYLARAFSEEKFTKPRNAIGVAKDLPVPEMEKLMLEHAEVTEQDLRTLANQRAQTAKDYVVEAGKISAERVFLLAPRMSADGIKDKGKAARVDFSLK